VSVTVTGVTNCYTVTGVTNCYTVTGVTVTLLNSSDQCGV
jgi:hypothetical protein